MENKIAQEFQTKLIRRITQNFLDILTLKLIQGEPMWGYKIMKRLEEYFGMKIRHSALYPLLNAMDTQGLISKKEITRKGRVRKVYSITSKGTELVEIYNDCLREQLRGFNVKEDEG